MNKIGLRYLIFSVCRCKPTWDRCKST